MRRTGPGLRKISCDNLRENTGIIWGFSIGARWLGSQFGCASFFIDSYSFCSMPRSLWASRVLAIYWPQHGPTPAVTGLV